MSIHGFRRCEHCEAFVPLNDWGGWAEYHDCKGGTVQGVEARIAAAVAAERERCARVADAAAAMAEAGDEYDYGLIYPICREIARRIRSGEAPPMTADTDTDRAAFVAAILDRPDDDLPRLVLADFLEERGEADRAEFIRVQCERVVTPGCVEEWPCRDHGGLYRCRGCWLADRERELLEGFCRDDLAPLFGLSPHETILPTLSGLIAPGPGVELLFRGGLVHRVYGPLAAFWSDGRCGCDGGAVDTGGFTPAGEPVSVACGVCDGSGQVGPAGPTPAFRELVRREPLPADGVVVTDRQPVAAWNGALTWFRQLPGPTFADDLPAEVFAAIVGYSRSSDEFGLSSKTFPTQAAAVAALSRALVTLAQR